MLGPKLFMWQLATFSKALTSRPDVIVANIHGYFGKSDDDAYRLLKDRGLSDYEPGLSLRNGMVRESATAGFFLGPT